jgi:hypothetical protein
MLGALIRNRIHVEPAALLIPVGFFSFAVEEFCGTWYQIGSFSLINMESGFTACVVSVLTKDLSVGTCGT